MLISLLQNALTKLDDGSCDAWSDQRGFKGTTQCSLVGAELMLKRQDVSEVPNVSTLKGFKTATLECKPAPAVRCST